MKSEKRNKHLYNQNIFVFGLLLTVPLVLEVTDNNSNPKSKEYIVPDSINLYLSGSIFILLHEMLPDDMVLC